MDEKLLKPTEKLIQITGHMFFEYLIHHQIILNVSNLESMPAEVRDQESGMIAETLFSRVIVHWNE